MLSIIAAIIIAICGTIVFCADESPIAMALSFVVLLCACILAGNSCYLTDVIKLKRLKRMCIVSMGLVCFQLCLASFRVRRYLDHGERFALVTSIVYLASQLILIYTFHSTTATLKRLHEEKSSPPVVQTRVWI
ncbi:hypothetical protein Bhyg_05640 [Pseudolycoriella hygida]|uniref:Uncharacterized protein n=1 Tax=Pseudolycoriella hygida TaxID=35572 RepID=A0A9Q0S1P3_9DIPT|nr:hypothetical protein Bhyg_05640 [Pseudolycoriella hygida]